MENKNTNFDILEMLEVENNSTELFPLAWEKSEEIKNELITSEVSITPEEDIFASLDTIKNIEQNHEETLHANFEFDVLNELSQETTNQVQIETNETFGSKFLWGIIFLIKYLTTSTVIFMLLLSASNYSAYIEIARSYLNPELLEQNKNALLSSVNGSQLLEETASGGVEKETTNQKVSTVKNKTYHSMDKLLNGGYDESLNMQIDIVPYENRVVIPKIGKNIPLLDVKNKTVQNVKELEDVFMEELSNGIIRYPGSAKPGEEGNSFIFGHSSNFPWMKWEYNDVFALLDNIVFGDEIIVYYNQKKYVYKIREKNIIKPGDVSVLKRNKGKSEISLMTCWPVGTTLNRMIVVWELVK